MTDVSHDRWTSIQRNRSRMKITETAEFQEQKKDIEAQTDLPK